ncbi:hypothetical protein DXG03_008228 [Asterophora parasitica]|uniref:Uncharacterized protein n=1 Tax=Asterophora parasitica TaxID=117018 RepID=A0A9P7G1V3_9AGAR|nr:hypothetical protein DXG03_008228 [Asterophora parasitica]
MPPKKRKISSLSGLELDLALAQVKKLRTSFIVEELPESDPAPDDTFTDLLDNTIAALESRANDPLSLPFSAADDAALSRFNIVSKGLLLLRPWAELRSAVVTSQALGSDQLWSNDAMYRHLTFLANSFTAKNGTSARMVIDTLFFRSTAMVPPPQKIIVVLENQVPAVQPRQSEPDTISGIVDYTAVVVDSKIAKAYIHRPPSIKKDLIGFFVAEAIDLEAHLPQALLELVACAKHLGRSHIRGALTTGFEWCFIIVDLDADSEGAKYWVSQVIVWMTEQSKTSSELIVEPTDKASDPALIAAILRHG